MSIVEVCKRGLQFVGFGWGLGYAIGQVFLASSWYALSIVILWSLALSILVGVILEEFVSFVRYVNASWWAVFVFASLSW